jgi:hypothetical protein
MASKNKAEFERPQGAVLTERLVEPRRFVQIVANNFGVGPECWRFSGRERMSRISIENVTAAIREVSAMSLSQKEALADEIHQRQPYMLASCLVQSRLESNTFANIRSGRCWPSC